jgi:hypothetical protein
MTPPEQIIGLAYRRLTSRLVIRCFQPSDVSMLYLEVDHSLVHTLKWMPWVKQEPLEFQERTDKVEIQVFESIGRRII